MKVNGRSTLVSQMKFTPACASKLKALRRQYTVEKTLTARALAAKLLRKLPWRTAGMCKPEALGPGQCLRILAQIQQRLN